MCFGSLLSGDSLRLLHLFRTDLDVLLRFLGLEPEVFEHEVVGVLLRVRSRQQLLSGEDRVGPRHEHHGLLGLAKARTARGEPDLRLRHDDTRGRDHAAHVPGIHRVLLLQGRSLDGDKRVDRYGLGRLLHVRQHVKQADAVVHLFAESDDASAANGESSLSDVFEGLQPLLVRASGDDIGVELRRRVEIVVVGGESGFFQLSGLLGIEHPQGGTDFQPHRIDLFHHFQNLVESALLSPDLPPGRPHAEPRAASRLGPARALQHLLDPHEFLRLNESLVFGGLGAVRAVLSAAPRLDRQQRGLLHHARVEILPVDSRRLVDELEQRRVVDRADLVFRPSGGARSHD
mmetsp:Transcript_18011/g.32232  ORF Transcript_18011/g.32232 Transcript_18011/m.32232 type:complete len:346 (-) Transcript_18011:36-1073(-)